MSDDTPTGGGSVDGNDAPLGVKLLAILNVVGGVLGLFGTLALLGTPLAILGLVFGALSVGQLVVAVGLWNLRAWAYRWTLVIVGLSVVLDLVRLLLGDIGAVVAMVLHLLVVGYLLGKSHRFE